VQVFGQHKTYAIEPEPGVGRELYWHQPPNVFSRPKIWIIEHEGRVPQPLYWHRKNPFDVPKFYIIGATIPTPQNTIGGGWFIPPDDGHGLDLERIKKDDRDFLNILIMAIHGLNRL
jgi:hypothetical protein